MNAEAKNTKDSVYCSSKGPFGGGSCSGDMQPWSLPWKNDSKHSVAEMCLFTPVLKARLLLSVVYKMVQNACGSSAPSCDTYGSPETCTSGSSVLPLTFHRIPNCCFQFEDVKLKVAVLECDFGAFQLLEACMNNCGKRFQNEVAKFRFLNELIKVLSPKVSESMAASSMIRRCN